MLFLAAMMVESDIRERAYRFVAYSAVTFSFCAIIAVFITLPMVNNYIASVHSRVYHEMEFCKLSAKEVMMEMNQYRAAVTPLKGEPASLLFFAQQNNQTRSKRHAAQCEGKYCVLYWVTVIIIIIINLVFLLRITFFRIL